MRHLSTLAVIAAAATAVLAVANTSTDAKELRPPACLSSSHQCSATWTVNPHSSRVVHTTESMASDLDLYFDVYANGKLMKVLAQRGFTVVVSSDPVLATVTSKAGPIKVRLANPTATTVRFTMRYWQKPNAA